MQAMRGDQEIDDITDEDEYREGKITPDQSILIPPSVIFNIFSESN